MAAICFCAFCEKGSDEVAKMIVGKIKAAAICNECIAICAEAIFSAVREDYEKARARAAIAAAKGGK